MGYFCELVAYCADAEGVVVVVLAAFGHGTL